MSNTTPRLFDEPPEVPVTAELLWRSSRKAQWTSVTCCSLAHEAVMYIGWDNRRGGQWLVRYANLCATTEV